jgi:alpha-tubulin suppressor-like RCC1 family protein
LTNIVAIATENSFSSQSLSLALRANGTVVAWGDNTYGESTPPGALSNLLSVAISAGYDHGLAVVNNGSAQFLQMPVGQTAYVGRNVTLRASATGAAPLSYQWLLNGTNVSGATNSSLVIPNVQFANAGSYQLLVSNSISTAISLPAPLTVVSNPALTFLAQMAGTTNYQGSTVFLGSPGVLGNGPLSYQWFFSTTNRNYVAVSGATNDALVLNPALAGQSGNYYIAVSNLFGGITSSPVNVLVRFEKAWGYSLGYSPVDAPFVLTNATAIAVGNYGVQSGGGDYYALSSAGRLSSWTGGLVEYGETNFSALSNHIVTAVAAGDGDALALKSDGTLFAIGNNVYGETNVPPAAAIGGIVAVACGDYHDLALNYLGTVIGWGQNTYQQTTNTAATNVVAIAAGGANSIALRADGSVITWGQYGNGLTTAYFPVPSSATNIIAVAAGETHFLALRANGTVVGWGENTYGQTTIPANWTNIVAISAAGYHSTVLHNDGTVSASGAYFPYQANSATAPPDLANVIAIAGSGEHDLALFGTRAPVFTVQPWDRSIPANVVTNITIAVHYQWQLDGTNIANATHDTLSLGGKNSAGGPINIPIGDYQLIASNAYGVAASKYMKISVFIPLGVALDATNLGWTTSGDTLWYGETNITHDGVAAAQSGDIGPFQQTILQTTVGTNYPGSYNFWWKVSSEQDFDFLEFRINGIVQTSISGEVGWQQVSIPVAAGTNVLLWRYYKEDTLDVGEDAGWVGDFSFIPGPPVINVQPQPAVQTVNWGTNVIFTVSAVGAPPLRYIWRQNGNPVGGNSPSLVLYNVGRAQSGTYSVIVTNVGGSTLSSSAVLNVLVPQLLSSPQILPNGGFQFTSTDINGGLLTPADLANFGAQASTDLVNWVTLPGALSLTNGMLLLQDNETNFGTRYYRIVEY